ncbi:hypothetical protein GNI_106090 [Gregarina niphandrodes]|uniref:Uncharacterized protein n=1 Tax=Gregarina niphandrodes TaxID=110365 RepID=A0A023B3Z2_GRENI|nr:hypothetical protein GNI_106090 [Gregarina niphandrodes]EZG56045.1 hypothetical protein GNI_106090 [Gregarina niphandrodes]|eukprot:XP_011131364.1 hypothetical protein GNI_106090 [Gregarina niphandrodes]
MALGPDSLTGSPARMENGMPATKGAADSSASLFSSAESGLPPAVKISLRAQGCDRKEERARISIRMDDPEQMIDKILDILAAKFPIHAFYQVLNNEDKYNEKIAQRVAPDTTPNTFQTKIQEAMYEDLVSISRQSAAAQTIVSAMQGERIVSTVQGERIGAGAETLVSPTGSVSSITNRTMTGLLKDALATLSADELVEVTTNVSPSNTSKLARVLLERCRRSSTSSLREVVSQVAQTTVQTSVQPTPDYDVGSRASSSGKWETVDESFLLADRETEHSNGAASVSSQFSITSGLRDSGIDESTPAEFDPQLVERVMLLSIQQLEELAQGNAQSEQELLQLVNTNVHFRKWVESLVVIRKQHVRFGTGWIFNTLILRIIPCRLHTS